MKSTRLLSILLTCASASLVRADFNPVTITPGSYTQDIVVEANAIPAVGYYIDVTAGSGADLGDQTFFEQGQYSRIGSPGGNLGVPTHNTTFASINNANMMFLMPPDYTQPNDLMIDSQYTGGAMTFATPTTATNLAILCTGGGGAITVNYTVTHSDASTETGSIEMPDWFHGGPDVVWGADGRCNATGGYNAIPANIDTAVLNDQPPYLYGIQITVSDASPVTSVAFAYTTGGAHGNIFAISGNASGASWSPIAMDPNSFDASAIVPATIPFPVTATMDQGTNIASTDGNVNTWFEQGYDRAASDAGLPVSGSTFNSFSQPTHHYKLADYTGNNAILIDTNNQQANITLSTPGSYTALSLLTAGGNEGAGNVMTNICVIQHADGVNETNYLYGYDWYDRNYPGAIALKGNGRLNMHNRQINSVGGDLFPWMFETYFLLNDTTSPVTNLLVLYKSSPNTSATTYIMALSASTGGIPPVVNYGPAPGSQTLYPGDTATMAVGTVGTAPITGHWEVENNGVYSPLTDGLDANGSYITGSQTYTLTISNLFLADGTNYHFVAHNSYGDGISPAGSITVDPQNITITPSSPAFYTSNNIPLKVNLAQGPAVDLQWFYVDPTSPSVTNYIADATNSTYTILAAPLSLSGFTYGVVATNTYTTNVASVLVSITDHGAFLASAFGPVTAEAYAGAPVTYVVDAKGNSPITYQWMVNGSPVNNNSNSYSFAVPCGSTTIQVAFSNTLSSATWVSTPVVTLQGDPSPINLTFNTDGTGWRTNGSGGNVPIITNGVLALTDGNGGEASSMYYTNALYVGGAWTASFTYNSHGGGADGTAFVIQNMTNAYALGGSGGALGYGGISTSLAFEINIYGTPGIAQAVDGNTGTYFGTGPVDLGGTNDIYVKLDWADGVLTASLTDAKTGDTYTTNYNVGPLENIVNGNLAYVGMSGGDGGVTSIQTVTDFQFHSVLPPVSLSVSAPAANGDVDLSWPNTDPNYQLQMSSTLSPASWIFGPSPTVTSGTNHVTINVNGANSQQFYRLLRVTCP